VNDLSGTTVLITGGAGFIGSFIVDQLLEEGVEKIMVLDNLARGSKSNIHAALRSGKVDLIVGDIRDRGLLDDILKPVDYCFHMAALRINQCNAEPREALEVMMDGTFNVADACVKQGVKKIVLASSASVYGMADSFPTGESHHPYNNRTLYGTLKLANEGILRSFNEMYGLAYPGMRYLNVSGPRMDVWGKYTEVLVRWYKMIGEGKRPQIYGDGKQTMDFIYVEDVARANILALKSDVTDEVLNVGSGVETSLEELCHLLLDVMGSELEPKFMPLPDQRRAVEVGRRLADVTKAKERIGFEAEVPLRNGLRRLVSWLEDTGANDDKWR